MNTESMNTESMDTKDIDTIRGGDRSVLRSDEFNQNYDTWKASYKTIGVLSKYEKTKVISERASQISDGSPVLVEMHKKIDNPYEIALLELAEGKIPFIIRRPYGNTYEYWKLKDLL